MDEPQAWTIAQSLLREAYFSRDACNSQVHVSQEKHAALRAS
jgi:hypothetical protein